MRLPSLRSVSVGFFGLLSGLLVVAWGFSICGSYAVTWPPRANAEISAALVRGRLQIAHYAGAGIGTSGVHGVWLGAPRKTTDVLGAFSCNRYGSGGIVTIINIPIPALAAIAALAAYLFYRRFRLTLAAWLSLFVIASIFLAVYAHPYEPRHDPSISERG